MDAEKVILAPIVFMDQGIFGRSKTDTGFIRQMAKDPSDIYLVAGGATSRRIADDIAIAIRRHRDYKEHRKREIRIVSADEMEALLSIKKNAPIKETIVGLLAKTESPRIGPKLSGALALPSDPYEGTDSRMWASVARGASRAGLSFHITLTAPDEARLEKLGERLAEFSMTNWRDLKCNEVWATNRGVRLLPPNADAALRQWGTRPGGFRWQDWTDQDISMGESGAPDPERELAFFVDRSTSQRPDVSAVTELIGRAGTEPDRVIAARGKLPDGRGFTVISAPNANLLTRYAKRFPHPDAVPDPPFTKRLLDLRKIGATAVLFSGPVAPRIGEAVRNRVASAIRTEGGVRVDDRGEVLRTLDREVTLQRLLGATDTSRKLRSRYGLTHVWVLDFASVGGSTAFVADSVCLDGGSTTYSGAQPFLPRKPSVEDRIRYVQAVRTYQAAKDAYENYSPVAWKRTLRRKEDANCGLTLKLVSLNDGAGRIVWDSTVRGTATTDVIESEDRVNVSGHLSRPNDLVAPRGGGDAGEPTHVEAGWDAGRQGVDRLLDETWLTGEPAAALRRSDRAPTSDRFDVAPRRTATYVLLLAANGKVKVAVNAHSRLLAGDRLSVRLRNGGTLTLVVRSSSASSALCVPARSADSRLVARIDKTVPAIRTNR